MSDHIPMCSYSVCEPPVYHAEEDEHGRTKYRLLRDYWVYDARYDRILKIKKGRAWRPSVPRWLHWLVDPEHIKYASLVHDVLHAARGDHSGESYTLIEADLVFWHLNGRFGCPLPTRILAQTAVHLVSWVYWYDVLPKRYLP